MTSRQVLSTIQISPLWLQVGVESVDPTILARDLGVTAILALVLYLIARAIAPLINAVANATKENADARKAMLEYWRESDHARDDSLKAATTQMNAMTLSIGLMNENLIKMLQTDKQRIEQNIAHEEMIGKLPDVLEMRLVDPKSPVFLAHERRTETAVKKVNQEIDKVLKIFTDLKVDLATRDNETRAAFQEAREHIAETRQIMRVIIAHLGIENIVDGQEETDA